MARKTYVYNVRNIRPANATIRSGRSRRYRPARRRRAAAPKPLYKSCGTTKATWLTLGVDARKQLIDARIDTLKAAHNEFKSIGILGGAKLDAKKVSDTEEQLNLLKAKSSELALVS